MIKNWSLVGVTLWEDNRHIHGGTTTLKNELRVHLIYIRVRQLICKCVKCIYVSWTLGLS
jgi:hypothetical protein